MAIQSKCRQQQLSAPRRGVQPFGRWRAAGSFPRRFRGSTARGQHRTASWAPPGRAPERGGPPPSPCRQLQCKPGLTRFNHVMICRTNRSPIAVLHVVRVRARVRATASAKHTVRVSMHTCKCLPPLAFPCGPPFRRPTVPNNPYSARHENMLPGWPASRACPPPNFLHAHPAP